MWVDKDDRRPPLQFAGFASVPADVSVGAVLSDMDFVVPGGRDRDTVASKVGAGLQPGGRDMPQLLPDGLGPDNHLIVALATPHPFSRPPHVPSYIDKAIAAQDLCSEDVNVRREHILGVVKKLSELAWAESALLLPLVHKWIRPVVARRNVVLMRELTFVCGEVDAVLMCDYVFGMPMLGWARHSPTMLQRTTRPPRAELPTPAENLVENRSALERAKPSRDHEADTLSWKKTKAEFEKQTMVGPFYAVSDLPGSPSLEDIRILNRFGILERHGGAKEQSVRNIDDGKKGNHNIDSANTATHRPADLDAVGALSRRVAERFPDQPLAGFPSDFSGAYRQATADPLQALQFVIASWDTELSRMVFFLAVTQLFGSGNAPLNFTRIPDWCCRVLAALFAIPAIHCVDDVIVIELLKRIGSGYKCWRSLAEMCGWDVPDKKSPPPSQFFRALGAMIDFRAYPGGPIRICPAEDRIEDLYAVLEAILWNRRLSPGSAGKLYGKLMFLSSQYFGRLGRALLRAYSRRQHQLSKTTLNPQIIAATNFWLSHIRSMRPREVPISLAETPTFVSYSDGEGEGAGVGIAIWCPNGTILGGYLQVPEEVREVWSRQATAGDHYDIFEIEAIGPALILHNFG